MKIPVSLTMAVILVLCISCQPILTAQPTLPTTGVVTPVPVGSQQIQTTAKATAPTHEPVPVAGGVFAFYSTRDGNSEIYVMNSDGSGLMRLTNDPAYDDSPAISPDGRQVVFLTSRDDPSPRFPDLKYEIYLVNSDGTGLLRLTTTDAGEDHPAWSPDGSKILFDADYDDDGFYEIYTIDPDGSNLNRLTSNQANDQFADWSPDGRQIAFSSDRNGNWDLFVMNADGSNQQPLTTSNDWELFPAWSPDGKQIVFNWLVPKSGDTDVYVMNSDGTGLNQLTDSPGYDENPTWAPDGSQIAFQTRRDGNFELYIMNRDGADQRPLDPHQSDELWPGWGPAVPGSGLVRFEKSAQTFAPIPTWKVVLADLDEDGDLDAVFSNSKQNDSQVWWNDGNGLFTDSGLKLGRMGHGLAVGDIDGDGDLDIVISTHTVSQVTRVYRNDGNGVYSEVKKAFQDNIGFSVNLYDLDKDGDLDAVGYGMEATRIFQNDGAGTFTQSEINLPLNSIWGDLDADGDVDVLSKDEGVGYSVQLNNGAGQFSLNWTSADANTMDVGDMTLGDLDADGDLDAVVTNGHYRTTSHPTQILMNDGSGQFNDSGQRLSAVKTAGVSLGDLDNDSDLDLVMTDYMEPCQIWLNDGYGQFTDSGFHLGDDQFYQNATLGDLDDDGDVDIFLATFGDIGGPNEIWFNQLK